MTDSPSPAPSRKKQVLMMEAPGATPEGVIAGIVAAQAIFDAHGTSATDAAIAAFKREADDVNVASCRSNNSIKASCHRRRLQLSVRWRSLTYGTWLAKPHSLPVTAIMQSPATRSWFSEPCHLQFLGRSRSIDPVRQRPVKSGAETIASAFSLRSSGGRYRRNFEDCRRRRRPSSLTFSVNYGH